MATVVWKSVLNEKGSMIAQLPPHSRVVFVTEQNNELCAFWEVMFPHAPHVNYTLFVAATGDEVPHGMDYVGSASMFLGSLTLHVFMAKQWTAAFRFAKSNDGIESAKES